MKKTLFAAALACALTLGGIVSYAQDGSSSLVGIDQGTNVFTSKSKSENLYLTILPKASESSLAMNFAIKRGSGDAESLLTAEQIESAKAKDVKGLSLSLGTFKADESFQLGVVSNNSFEPFVSSEPGYYTSVNENSFYSLDFSENPFDGARDIYIMGEPLPAPAVTLIVALAAGATFLLYKNRKQRVLCSEQA